MDEPEVFIMSSNSTPMPWWMTAAALAVGVIAGATAFFAYRDSGVGARFVYNAVVSVICLIGAGVKKSVYLSDCGVVRDVTWWGRKVRRVLWWDDVTKVSLMTRGRALMLFFDSGDSGWKVPFLREDERTVLEIVRDMIPDVEVERLGSDA